MDIETLRRDAHAFRRALEACHGDLDPIVFGHFPRGCCGTVSELLAVFLKKRGHGAFAYVCGESSDGDGQPMSHAWLERDGLIVDVTRDQFGKFLGPVFMGTDRSWHDAKFPKQKKPGDFGELPPGLCEAYARIEQELERRSGSRAFPSGA